VAGKHESIADTHVTTAQTDASVDPVTQMHETSLTADGCVPPTVDAPVDVWRPAAGQIFGQYRILDRLGAGGMGEVYRAEHKTMARVVALKVLAPHLVQDERARARFLNEVRSAGRLAHPNIVIAHDAAEDHGRFFLAMEYVDGVDLARLVGKFGVVPIAAACEMICQAAAGLQHAHEQGMVHRDIKPANLILLKPRTRSARPDAPPWESVPLLVKVLDFGLARFEVPLDAAAPGLTREGTVVGTPEFMSPEQASGGRVDIRSDIYSLGCTLYHLIAGRPPFVGDTLYEVLNAQLKHTPAELHTVQPTAPVALSAVVARTLAKNPNERYQTPAELIAALRPWVSVSYTASTETALSPARQAPSPAPSARQPAAAPLYDPMGSDAVRLLAWTGLFLTLAAAALAAWMLFRPGESSNEESGHVPKSAYQKPVD
jgi:serine/threonine-protein kinase